MQTRGARGRRGFAIAFVALCLTAIAVATPAEAAAPTPLKAAKVYAAKPKPKVGPRVLARRRAFAARQRKARKLAAQRRALLRAKAPRAKGLRGKAAAKHKQVPLSLPELALFAIAPFVLMSIYLLGADHMRRRVPRKRRRRASLVITRVSDR